MRNFIKKSFSIFLCLALSFALCFASGTGDDTEENLTTQKPTLKGNVQQIVVLHTNDHHGALETKDGLGGVALRASLINDIRKKNRNVLLLDAGDINTGTALSNMFKAEPDIKAYNALKYDAVAFGNHEFDGDFSLLQKQIKDANFTWLCANVYQADGKTLGEPYIIKNFNGVKVGIFGLTTRRTLTIASPDESLEFRDELECAKATVEDLRNNKKLDLVILLGHLGSAEEAEAHVTSIKIAQNVPGIDLIIDGHSHTNMTEPLVVNGTPIVSSYEWGKNLGMATFMLQNKKIVDFAWQAIPVSEENLKPDASMQKLLAPYIERAQKELDKTVATSTKEFDFGNKLSRYRETALGNLATDGALWYVQNVLGKQADFCIINGGTIRSGLPKGDVTVRDVATVLPFDNSLYVLKLKGAQVLDLFQFVGTINQGAGAFAQVSKQVRYSVRYDKNGKNGKITALAINGAPVNPQKTYTIVTNDYLAGGGDGYAVLTLASERFNTSCTLRDAVIAYMQNLPQPLNPDVFVDGRIKITGGVTP